MILYGYIIISIIHAVNNAQNLEMTRPVEHNVCDNMKHSVYNICKIHFENLHPSSMITATANGEYTIQY